MSKHQVKRKFTIIEYIPIMFKAAYSFILMKMLKRKRLVNKQFKERIMLAVTEVNGCALCSYMHTKMALKTGMSIDEIKQILSGELSDVPDEQVIAVLFAKDFAFNKETIDKEFYNKLIDQYGFLRTKLIIYIVNFITMTNAMGISLDLFKATLTFKHVKKSCILNEILIPLTTLLLFPLFLILSLIITPFIYLRIIKNSKNTN